VKRRPWRRVLTVGVGPAIRAPPLGQSGFQIVPKAGFHKLAKMPRVGGHDDDLGTTAKGECLGSKDDVNIEVVRRRSWTSLLSGLCPKLRGEP